VEEKKNFVSMYEKGMSFGCDRRRKGREKRLIKKFSAQQKELSKNLLSFQ
jgi:hypothetical protein